MQRISKNIRHIKHITTGHGVMFTAHYDCLIQINAAVTILDVYKLGDSGFGGLMLSLFGMTQVSISSPSPKMFSSSSYAVQ